MTSVELYKDWKDTRKQRMQAIREVERTQGRRKEGSKDWKEFQKEGKKEGNKE